MTTEGVILATVKDIERTLEGFRVQHARMLEELRGEKASLDRRIRKMERRAPQKGGIR
jgi:hypothetical protein